ncbi:polycystin-1-like protein 2 [Pseudorasbora parva]|uniref:polycystin-1-like protein 2 n=1 Tax=Pseudorasbora parva TaxID=51549 RepID=UPI00351E8D3A
MDGRLFTLLFLIIINIISACGKAAPGGLSCPEHYLGFESSCYEFVNFQRSFLSAQAWCERDGGHLAFMRNEETQQFLQKHMQPDQDWWIGLVSSGIDLTLDTEEGLIWLDGSDVMDLDWLSEPMLETGCGHINTHSGFNWKITTNCSQEYYFICEFELGRSLSCVDSAVLQCGSDQVIEVDESFYGRKTPHYCRNNMASSRAASPEQCGWIDVRDLVAELCNGQQVCTAVTDGSSFGEPCPVLGSYLSVEYHCKSQASGVIVKRSADGEGEGSFVKSFSGGGEGGKGQGGKGECQEGKGEGGEDQGGKGQGGKGEGIGGKGEGQGGKGEGGEGQGGKGECQGGNGEGGEGQGGKGQGGEGQGGKGEGQGGEGQGGKGECQGVKGQGGKGEGQGGKGEGQGGKGEGGEGQGGKGQGGKGEGQGGKGEGGEGQGGKGECQGGKGQGGEGQGGKGEGQGGKGEGGEGQGGKGECQGGKGEGQGGKGEGGKGEGQGGKGQGGKGEGGEGQGGKGECQGGKGQGGKGEGQGGEGGEGQGVKGECQGGKGQGGEGQGGKGEGQGGKGKGEGGEGQGGKGECQGGKGQGGKGEGQGGKGQGGKGEGGEGQGGKGDGGEGQGGKGDGGEGQGGKGDGGEGQGGKGQGGEGQGGKDKEEQICYSGRENTLTLLISCPVCDTNIKKEKINLKLENSDCDKIYWYVEGQSEGETKKNVLNLQDQDGKELEVKVRKLRPLKKDILVLVICKKGGTTSYGQRIINYSLIETDNNQLKQNLENQLKLPRGDDTEEIKEDILSDMCSILEGFAILQQPTDMVHYASALKSLIKDEDKVNANAQKFACCVLDVISNSHRSIDLTPENIMTLAETAKLIVESTSHILGAFNRDRKIAISSYMLNAVDCVHKFLLANKTPDLEPFIISTPNVQIYVNRLSPINLQKEPFSVQNSLASFKLPNLGSDILPVDEPVDVKMTHFIIDPWIEGQPINSSVAGLSLSQTNGSGIPVANLTEEIEIFLPRLGTAVTSSVLDLRNSSTSMITITTSRITLVLKLRPSEELTLLVLLGYQRYPTEENNVAKVTFPRQGNSQDERYTWVLGPSDMAIYEGIYYLHIRPVVGPGIKSVNASITITSITAQCIFWEENRSNWSDHGCRVGPKTTANVTQCLCNHLTFFGSSFFIMPNTVDPSKSAELFSNFANNPVVVCFIGAIFLVYALAAAWARRKDLQDKTKVKITVLEDNDPFAEYRYLLKISTGHRMGASTSSRVVVTLQGTEGECEPHHLTDPDKPVFERGGVDLFLLTTPFPLGELQSIRLWHDNTGDHPAWYVNSVMVEDLQTEQIWHFLCSSWLAVDIDDCTVERVFPVASEMEMKGFSNLFFMKTTTDFCDGHIWYSVVSRPPSSTFTRVQRVSCCFSVLLCSMLASIMFYGIPTDPTDQTMDLGPIKLTFSQVKIGILSSFVVFPINLIIVGIFRHSRPRKKKAKKQKAHKQPKPLQMEKEIPYEAFSPHFENNLTVDFLITDIQRITYLFGNAMRCPVLKTQKDSDKTDIITLLSELQNFIEQQHFIHKNETSSVFWPYSHHLSKQLENLEGEVKLLGPSGFSRPGCYGQVLLQIQSMKKLLESQQSSRPFTEQWTCALSPKKERSSSRKGLPWWCVYVGWLLVAATSVISGYFTMLYGLKYGKDLSVSWIISIVLSFTESLFFTQPVKVFCLAIFFALVVKKVNFEDEELLEILRKKTSTCSDDFNGVRLAKRVCSHSFYQPPPSSDIEKIKRNMVKQQKARALIIEILVFLGFLWMLLLVAYGQRNENGFYLTEHIRQSFRKGISESMNHNDVFTWANDTLLSNLFGEQPGFITDGNSKLVGGARLRQVRVSRDSCTIAKSMRQAVPHCNAPYSWENEDMGSYGPGWEEFNFVNGSKDTVTAWQYQSQSTLKAVPVWGMIALYRGGGYVMDLGSDLENASRKLQYLFNSTWLDMYTRAVFIEFTVYNANVNLFCIVTLILESTAVGAFQFRSVVQSVRLYQSTGGFQSFLMASQVFYFLFIIYYMFLQGKLMKKQKWAYFKNKWNLLDLAIIILSWSSLSVFIKRTVQGEKDIQYYQQHKDQFPSFNDTVVIDSTLGYLMAFLVLLACLKLWHLLRLNPKLHLITSTLQRAWNDMSSFIVVIFIILLAYSITCNLIFGWKLYSYKTLPDAFKTIFCLQFGIFNYDEVITSDPVLGALIISTCVIFITFVILTLFVSIILEAFGEEQQNHQPSEEEEIVDLIFVKILSLFGIKSKKKEAEASHHSDKKT